MRVHFNIMRDKVTRQCPQTTTFEEKGEPKQIRTEVLLLTARPNGLHGPTEKPGAIYTDAGTSPQGGKFLLLLLLFFCQSRVQTYASTLFGRTKIPHTLTGLGSAGPADAVPYPGKATQISHN